MFAAAMATGCQSNKDGSESEMPTQEQPESEQPAKTRIQYDQTCAEPCRVAYAACLDESEKEKSACGQEYMKPCHDICRCGHAPGSQPKKLNETEMMICRERCIDCNRRAGDTCRESFMTNTAACDVAQSECLYDCRK